MKDRLYRHTALVGALVIVVQVLGAGLKWH
jgi:hypothetical protein